MLDVLNNSESMVLFFHDLDSDNRTVNFTEIKRKQKLCETVDYRQDFAKVFEIYDALIQANIKKYEVFVLAGEGLGGWFANHFAHKYNLPALLIEPCIYPRESLKESLADRTFIPQEMRLSFPTSNTNDVAVIIVDKDDPAVAIAKRTLVNLPDSWDIDYIRHIPQRIGLGIDINYHLNMLCGDAILDIDFDHVDEAAYARYKAQY
ncbi:YqiA/YcfP family alpha/beta fold hydrolase [Psychrobacter arenosus]|uniref:YqiA/YcfP family alpha/beta fold hydrolase n=1 Tax=Psychrobacter arenosus TaxID=256326 RepID=UPI00191974E4|nr:YqiA/YcfP family alpha/beta fold hydrolase [Psychrobacter arenosus]